MKPVIETSSERHSKELGETWASRNAFAFGRTQKGVQRTQVPNRVVEVDDEQTGFINPRKWRDLPLKKEAFQKENDLLIIIFQRIC